MTRPNFALLAVFLFLPLITVANYKQRKNKTASASLTQFRLKARGQRSFASIVDKKQEARAQKVDQELWAIDQIKSMQAMQTHLLSLMHQQLAATVQINQMLTKENQELQKKLLTKESAPARLDGSDIAKLFNLAGLVPSTPLTFEQTTTAPSVHDQARNSENKSLELQRNPAKPSANSVREF